MDEKNIAKYKTLIHHIVTGLSSQERTKAFYLLIEQGYAVKYKFFGRKEQHQKIESIAFAVSIVAIEAVLLDLAVKGIKEKVEEMNEFFAAIQQYFDLAATQNEKIKWFHSNFKGPGVLALLDTLIDLPDDDKTGDDLRFAHRLYEELLPHIVQAVNCGATRNTLTPDGEKFAEALISTDFEIIPKTLGKMLQG